MIVVAALKKVAHCANCYEMVRLASMDIWKFIRFILYPRQYDHTKISGSAQANIIGFQNPLQYGRHLV